MTKVRWHFAFAFCPNYSADCSVVLAWRHCRSLQPSLTAEFGICCAVQERPPLGGPHLVSVTHSVPLYKNLNLHMQLD